MARFLAFAFLAVAAAPSLAGCSHAAGTRETPGIRYSGVLAVTRTYASGQSRGERSRIAVTLRAVPADIVVQQTTIVGKTAVTEFVANVAPDGSLSGLHARDDAGGETAVRFAPNGSVATLVEKLPGGGQGNRIAWSDGSYRSVEKLVLRSATIVSRARSDALGRGSWSIQVFPRSNSSSTYYGFLNDAEMQYDYAVQVQPGIVRLFSNGGFAKGYDDPPAMHLIAAEPSWFGTSRLYRVSAGTIIDVDPMAATMEVVRTRVDAPTSDVPGRIVVSDTLTRHFVAAFSRSGDGISSIVMSETIDVPGGVRIPHAFAEIVREHVRRLMRFEVAEAMNPLVVVRRPK